MVCHLLEKDDFGLCDQNCNAAKVSINTTAGNGPYLFYLFQWFPIFSLTLGATYDIHYCLLKYTYVAN